MDSRFLSLICAGLLTTCAELAGARDDLRPKEKAADLNAGGETPGATPPADRNTPIPGTSPAEIYRNDFKAAVGGEWSRTATSTTPSGRRFLGEFGNTTVTLTLSELPAHSQVTLSFALFIIRSWDGNATATGKGPDVWDLRVGSGPTLLHTSFSNNGFFPGLDRQSYPDVFPGSDHPARTGAAENNTLGYTFAFLSPGIGTRAVDSVYLITRTFAHRSPSLTVHFSASGLQKLADESWGLDNVAVNLSP